MKKKIRNEVVYRPDEITTLKPGILFDDARVYTADGRVISTDPVVYQNIANSSLLATQELLQYFDKSTVNFYKAGFAYGACTNLRLTVDRYLNTLNNIYEVFCVKCKRMCPNFNADDTDFITNEAKMLIDAIITYMSYSKEQRAKCDLISLSMAFVNAIYIKIYNNARLQLSSYIVELTNEDSIDSEDISDAYMELNRYAAIMVGDMIYESNVLVNGLYAIDEMIINTTNMINPKLEE